MTVEFSWSHGRAVVSPTAGMLVDAVFRVGDQDVRPFARAPWLDEPDIDPGTPGHVRVLGGDFLALPFGSAAVPSAAVGGWNRHADLPVSRPLHGFAAEADWTVTAVAPDHVSLRLDFPAYSTIERVERTLSGVPGLPELRIEHVVHAREAASVPLGLHPVFALPAVPHALQLEVGFTTALAYPAVIHPGRSRIPAGAETRDLAEWDAHLLPGKAAREDIVLLAGVDGPIRLLDRTTGYGAALDWDHEILPNAMLWISDRGIDGPPYSGRYRGLGVEPVASAFDFPPDVSIHDNPMSARGIPTSVELDPAHPLTVRHSVRAFRLDDEETIRS
jgi:hypothetical protein